MKIDPGVIHLWKMDLDQLDAFHDPGLFHFLDSEEQTRAKRFATAELKNRFVLAHAATREILSRYLSCTPNAIEFTQNAFGKPMLSSRALEFNLSHSQNTALLAVTDRPIGVDVEYIARSIDVLGLAKRFFAAEEYEDLLSYSTEEQKILFFRIWTRKEAFIKAVGKGLSQNLDSFVVSSDAHPENALRHVKPDAALSADWVIREAFCDDHCIAAVAVEKFFSTIEFFSWST